MTPSALGLTLAARGELWEILAIVVFLLAPLWKGVLEARKQARERRQRTDRGTTDPLALDDEDEEPDVDPWEALLRGEAEPPPEPPPVPAPVARREAPPPRPVAVPVAAPMPEPVGVAPPAGEERSPLSALASVADERPLSRVEVHSTDAADQLGLAVAGRTLGPRRRRRRGGGTGKAGRHPYAVRDARWRQAVVFAEIVGAPTSLRRPSAGPVGLR